MPYCDNIFMSIRVKPKSIQYGGSKDKRGITSQLVTCYR